MNDAEVAYKELKSLMDFLEAFVKAEVAACLRCGNRLGRQQRESCCSP